MIQCDHNRLIAGYAGKSCSGSADTDNQYLELTHYGHKVHPLPAEMSYPEAALRFLLLHISTGRSTDIEILHVIQPVL